MRLRLPAVALACTAALAAARAAVAQSTPMADRQTLPPTSQTAQPGAATAERFVRALQRGAWGDAAALSALAPPNGAAPDAFLQGLWTQLTAQLGAVEALTANPLQREGATRFVDLDARFARSDVTLRVVLDSSDKVTGFWVRPPRPRPWSAPPYADTARFDERDVQVGGEPLGPALPGTLTMPRVAAGTRVPVVVLVHGSGPSDRDEQLGPNRPFKDLAWGLASRGIAVLRYDKRTHAAPASLAGGPVTVERETILDALAALDVARTSAGIDPRRVVLLGHSLGGAVAPEIARRDARAAGVVLLAPGGARKSGTVLLEQFAYVDAAAGGQGRAQLEALRPLLAQLDARALAPTANVLGVPASYWYDLEDRRPLDAARALDVPVLALFGGRDYQVPEADAVLWERALAGRQRAEVVRVSDADHLFRPGTGMATPDDYTSRGANVAPAVIDRVARFVLTLPPFPSSSRD